ncbi:unnamed protein product [Medioppia subpectinata]|uniref:Uncharacterized protein n=1 Tax=Medioppia subpectinata TaxID=1979941 RepID=A0A7R9KJS8_9ACAR|nr:unnamed protein product [Medioppia subpectinata]CAG2103610.1 unnamed protein product [Medioppia subpectinata]
MGFLTTNFIVHIIRVILTRCLNDSLREMVFVGVVVVDLDPLVVLSPVAEVGECVVPPLCQCSKRKTAPSYRKRSDPALTTTQTNTLANNTLTHDPNASPGVAGGSPTTSSPEKWAISSSEDEDDQSQSDAYQHGGAGTPTNNNNNTSPGGTPQHTVDEDTPPPLPPRPPSEKRKQIRNEIIESEESHVERLKFIHHVFYKPLQKDGLLTADQLSAVFSNTKRLMKVHNRICKMLNATNKSFEQLVCDIFCGPLGNQLEAEASVFCTRTLNGMDTWRARKKDSRLKNFLDPELRTKGIPDCSLARLSLEDLLAGLFQRPLRYPLLLDRLLQATPSDSIEYEQIARALARSRDIASRVNEETRKAESKQRLSVIKSKTDIAGPNLTLDFNDQNLLYEGPLTWRITKQKEVHVWLILTDRILVILTRDSSSDNKFTLKNHTNPSVKNNMMNNKTQHSPIVLLHDLFTRDVATDQNSFFLISTDQDVFYEFAANNPNEKKQWKESISKANKTSLNKQHVIKLKDLTSQPSAEEEIKPKDEELEPERPDTEDVSATVVVAGAAAALTTDDQNNNSNAAPEESQPVAGGEETNESQSTQTPRQSRVEGIIRYVREDEVRPQLISPTRVTISSENFAEALAVHSPEHRIKEIDDSVRHLLNEKRSILAKMRGIKDQYEWTVVSDLGEHDEVSSAAREVTFFDRAMSLVSTLGTTGLTANSYAPLVSLRDQIDALLARLTLSQMDSRAVADGAGGHDDSGRYLGANESSDETAVYF